MVLSRFVTKGYFLALIDDLGSYNLPVISGLSLEQLPGPDRKLKIRVYLMLWLFLKKVNKDF